MSGEWNTSALDAAHYIFTNSNKTAESSSASGGIISVDSASSGKRYTDTFAYSVPDGFISWT